MEWSDRGLILSTRRHGETALIVALLTREHGRHGGVVHGQRRRALLQPGTLVAARWRARLSEHLGSFTLEPETGLAAPLLDDALRLLALASACALVEGALAEREPHPALFDGTVALFEALPGAHGDAAYVQWEVGLLRDLGFGLDLTRCALGGPADDLGYVSPRSGRAVSREAAEPYRDRLLPLPGFLLGAGEADAAEVLRGLDLTGHFIERVLFAQSTAGVPAARGRYVDAYRRAAARSDRQAS